MTEPNDLIKTTVAGIEWESVGPGSHATCSAETAAAVVAELILQEIVKKLCEALQVPYDMPDGHEIRHPTLDEILTQVKSRSDMLQTLFKRIEVVDPKWLDALRKGEDLWEGKYPPEVKLVIAFVQPPEGNLVAEIWAAKAVPFDYVVDLLTQSANEFRTGSVERIK